MVSNAELLRGHANAGLICRPAAADLFDRMVELQQDEGLRNELGCVARRVAETEYSMEQMIDSYPELDRVTEALTNLTLIEVTP